VENPPSLRIGIDLGGTKIAGIALDSDGSTRADAFRVTPANDYPGCITAIVSMIASLENQAGGTGMVGIGVPGSLVPMTGRMQNANSTWLNGMPLKLDLERALSRPVRLANDANCFAVSEATDGSGRGAGVVFGVIIGTGCGGGIVIDGKIVDGPLGIAGEWGHTPLPGPNTSELPPPRCWCGRRGCMETWVSGPAVSQDHEKHTGHLIPATEIAALAVDGDKAANGTIDRLASRLARGLATVMNILDPDVIVLGGGLSSISALYDKIPDYLEPHIFADVTKIDIRPPKWGPASGVRGAARLWPNK